MSVRATTWRHAANGRAYDHEVTALRTVTRAEGETTWTAVVRGDL